MLCNISYVRKVGDQFVSTKDEVLDVDFLSIGSGRNQDLILDDVYVTPSYRKQGSAKQLIDTAILFARHENALRISLETQKNNIESHRLYAQIGFMRDDEFNTFHCFLK